MLQFITHTNERFTSPADGALQALRGGCRWIQLRMKGAADRELIAEGRRLHDLCRDFDAKFIVDDRVDLVDAVGADGVHLGLTDMAVNEARRLLGDDKIIGATANTFEHIVNAAAAGADYIGLGPFRFTYTKKRLSPILGLDGYRDITERMRRAEIALPVVAIGGITVDDVEDIIAAGVSGIAVSGAIINAANPVLETKLFIKKLCQIS